MALDRSVTRNRSKNRSRYLAAFGFIACVTGLTPVLIPAPAMASRAAEAVASPRHSYDFNQGWKTHTGEVDKASEAAFDDRNWQAATLPHAFNETEAFAKDIHDLSTSIVWYRKTFRIPKGTNPAKAFLEFQGVRQAAEVWVNGVSVGLNENGVMAFGFDITKALKTGDNVIAVRVDNDWKYKERATGSGFQWQDKNFYANYGGINKPVRLHLTGGVYQTLPLYSSLGTTGTYIWADDFDVAAKAATVHAESETRNDSTTARKLTLIAMLRDLDGKVVAKLDGGEVTLAPSETKTLSTTGRVSGLNFWSWGYGYLYTVTTELVENGKVIDAVDTRTGFRQTEFGKGVIKLNGRVLMMKGYAQRSTNEWPAVGMSVPPWINDLSNGLMVEGNGNLVRWMHVTPAKAEIESADRVGLIQAVPAGDSEGEPKDRRWDQRLEVMRDNIIYNRNNPSILFWESGNKGINEEHMAQMKAIRDQYDPHGGRVSGSREMLDSAIAEYGGEMLYVNKSGKLPFWAMEYSRDEAARAYQDDFTPPFHKDAPSYNRNQESLAVENVKRWWDFYQHRSGSGDRVSSGGVNIGWTDSNSHFRGDNNYRRSGEVDAMRLTKDSFFANQVMWDGWVNAEGKHTYIFGHWNYAPGTMKDIYVVSNAPKVELFRNGKSLGQGVRSDGFLFTFKGVAYEAGELKAVATYADGATSGDVRKTAGAPAGLRLTPITGPRGLVADGADVALFDIEVVDSSGQRVPTAFNPVSFKLEGAAEWKGGIAQKGVVTGDKKASDNYVLATTLPVELGVNRVMIRSTTKAGAVKLIASAEGLKGAEISLKSRAIAVKDGLSEVFAEDAQPVNLKRGPTPLTPSFAPFRQTLKVAAITAGSAASDARLSQDDNERTGWSSDGTPNGAWIDYDLGSTRIVNALSLKLTGWRLRTYPIKVTVDDKVVYEGSTAKSLGYVDLDFAATNGRHVRITLTGPSEDRDAFGKIVELAGNKEAQSVGADKVPTGWRLSIIEVDVLGPVE